MTTGATSGGAAGSAMLRVAQRIEDAVEAIVALGRERDDHAAARLDLLDVAEHLLEDARPAARCATTGSFSSMSAIGPCFISPAG